MRQQVLRFTLLAVCLKQIKEEYRTYLMLAAGLFFGYYLLEQIRYLIQSMNQLRQYLSIDNIYMESILKMIGITCLGEFTCDFVKTADKRHLDVRFQWRHDLQFLVLACRLCWLF